MSETEEDRAYYAAGEAAFIRRRGTPFLLSPTDFALLRQWRQRTRQAFLELFSRGYEAVDFVDGAYILRPKEPEPR